MKVNTFTLVPLRELSSMHAQGHHLSSHSHDRVSARAFIVPSMRVLVLSIVFAKHVSKAFCSLFRMQLRESEDGSLGGRRDMDMR